MNRFVLATILTCVQLIACATVVGEQFISKEKAIEVSNSRLKNISACIDSTTKVEAIFFATGKDFVSKFGSPRGIVPDAEKLDPARAYWSVLISYRLRNGRTMTIGSTVDAISGTAMEGEAQHAPSFCGK